MHNGHLNDETLRNVKRRHSIVNLFVPVKPPQTRFARFTELVRDFLWHLLIINPPAILYFIKSYIWNRFKFFVMAAEYPDILKEADKIAVQLLKRDLVRMVTGHKIVTNCTDCSFSDYTYVQRYNGLKSWNGDGTGLCFKCDKEANEA